MKHIPQRIVCLSAEAADWLWRIGAWENVVGVTAFFTVPPDASPKPRVSGFSSARMQEIAALNPDLVITFSDVQADFAAELIKHGFPVLATNQRTLTETEATLSLLGRTVGREVEAERLLAEFRERLAPVPTVANRPRVYFEEWNDPLISGIGWVGELIQRAGGVDVFPELRKHRAAKDRAVCRNKFAARIRKSFLPRGAENRWMPPRFHRGPVGRRLPPFARNKFLKFPARIFCNLVSGW